MRVKHIRECSPAVPAAKPLPTKPSSLSADSTKPDNYQTNASICRLVERYPCMYYRTHPEYLRKGVVEKAWEEISEEMGESISACKERWRNIRTSFARSINVNKVPSSANRTKPYYLHEELQFLAKHITPGIPVARRNYNNTQHTEDSSFSDTSFRDESSLGFAAMKTDEDDSQEHCVEEAGVGTSSDTAEEERPKSPAHAPLLHLPRLTPRTLPVKLVDVDDNDEEEVVDDGTIELEVSIAEPEPDPSPSKKRQRLDSEEAPLPDTPDRNGKPLDLGGFESDFDALFLQALLPEVKMMAFHQKILFKHRIYQALLEIFGGGAHNKPDPFSAASAAASAAVAAVAASGYSGPPIVTVSPTVTPIPPSMINVTTSDLYLLRRLGHLLQMPNNTIVNTEGTVAVHTVTKDMNSGPVTVTANAVPISASSAGAAPVRVSLPATVNAPIPASVRGALTRSGSNMMRVTMVNTPNPLPIDVAAMSQPLKEEPLDMPDD